MRKVQVQVQVPIQKPKPKIVVNVRTMEQVMNELASREGLRID